MQEYERYRRLAEYIAVQAGKKILLVRENAYRKDKSEIKSPSSIVTQGDLVSEELCIRMIQERYPEHKIWAEESGAGGSESPYEWCIDPIDGTWNYAHGMPMYGVSVGLLKNGEPIAGAICLPELHIILSAHKGGGATCNQQPIAVSQRPLAEGTCLAHPRHQGVAQSINALSDAAATTRIFQSSAYEMSMIALGRAEVCVSYCTKHDNAAGTIIVREAGGRVTNHQGVEWTGTDSTIVVTNGLVHEQVLDILQKHPLPNKQ